MFLITLRCPMSLNSQKQNCFLTNPLDTEVSLWQLRFFCSASNAVILRNRSKCFSVYRSLHSNRICLLSLTVKIKTPVKRVEKATKKWREFFRRSHIPLMKEELGFLETTRRNESIHTQHLNHQERAALSDDPGCRKTADAISASVANRVSASALGCQLRKPDEMEEEEKEGRMKRVLFLYHAAVALKDLKKTRQYSTKRRRVLANFSSRFSVSKSSPLYLRLFAVVNEDRRHRSTVPQAENELSSPFVQDSSSRGTATQLDHPEEIKDPAVNVSSGEDEAQNDLHLELDKFIKGSHAGDLTGSPCQRVKKSPILPNTKQRCPLSLYDPREDACNGKGVAGQDSYVPRKLYNSSGKWSEWWARLVIMVAVWTCTGNLQAEAYNETNICQRNNVKADQICDSLDLRNNISALDDLCKCRIIHGHLHFVLQEQGDDESIARLNQYSFPGLREITHHLLVYRVFNLTSLRHLFPNLAVIRGDVLFHNYALVIYDVPSLEDVGLVNLSVILRGSVRIERNPRLCYVNTIDWNNITVGRLAENYINRNRPEGECPSCPETSDCQRSKPCGSPRCWSKNHCQKTCGAKCFGGCDGNDCCHSECIGGCSRPNDPTACHACRKLRQNGRCVSACSKHMYKVLDYRCEKWSFCAENSKSSKGHIEGYFIKNDTQECVRGCQSGYKEAVVREGWQNVSICQPCENKEACPKYCHGKIVRSVGEAQWFRACKIVDGSLTIHISGGDIERELEENLSSIEEVTGYVKIFRSNVTSLNFLRSLKKIGGGHFIRSNYSLEILDNANLQSLWNWTERDPEFTIERGKVFAQSNPKLCLHHIQKLINKTNIGGSSETDVSMTSNGDKVPCNVTSLKAKIQPPRMYGTLTVEVTDDIPQGTIYFIYKKAPKNISLYESEGPCTDQGWSTMEKRITAREEGKKNHFSIINLQPFTRYAVYVKTYPLGTTSKGAQSDIMYATTVPFNPTKPVGLKWDSPDSNSLDIWWDPPRNPNGIIDHYMVNLTLLKEVPMVPPDLRFCEKETMLYIDNKMRIKENSGKPLDSSWASRLALEEEEEKKGKKYQDGGDDETCKASATPSCCACSRSSESWGDQDVIGQIQFEDFIMDNIYVKKVTTTRIRREASYHYHAEDIEFETGLQLKYSSQGRPSGETNTRRRRRNTEIPARERLNSLGDASKRNLSSSVLGGGVGANVFSTYQNQVVFVFPSEESIVGRYIDHHENLTMFEERDPENGDILLKQTKRTKETRLRISSLRHFSLYSVSVSACQEPDANNRKLCSSIPARIAAFTKPSESVDMIIERDLIVVNTSLRDTVEVTWSPPKSPNGAVIAYIINLQMQGGPGIDKCVSSQDFEERRWVRLPDLSPGNYSIRVQVRSKARYGNFSSPVTFVIVDDVAPTYFSFIVVSSLLAVAGALVAAVICWWWRRYRSRYTIPDTLDKVDVNPYYREGFAPGEIFQEEFIFWRDDLRVFHEKPLGQGYFGMVFQGQLTRNGQVSRVAVKTHRESATTEEISQFLKEAAVMQNIKCHHVVQLLGVVGDYAPVYVVMELMPEGDLKSFLKKHSANFITEQKLIEMAVEAADGMAYLSDRKLVHRDLAARNCMLDDNLTLKIGDFGLTRNLKSDYYRKEGQGVLPVKWMAPESLQFSMYTTQSDVWSYGVLLWEMATRGVTPYKNHTNDEVIRLVVEKYATLGRPRNCPRPLQRLMRQCWNYNPKERPNFLAITKFLLKQTSSDYQQRFEQVSFYHKRLSDYSRYKPKEEGGYMTEKVRENEGDESDDIALLTSPDLSNESSDEDFTLCRFDHKQFQGKGQWPKKKSRHSKLPQITERQSSSCRTSSVFKEGNENLSLLPKNHLYTNFALEERPPCQLSAKNPLIQSYPGRKPAGLQNPPPQLVIPGDNKDLPYAQLQLSTPSTPASNPLTPSMIPLTPITNQLSPGLHVPLSAFARAPSHVLKPSTSIPTLLPAVLGSSSSYPQCIVDITNRTLPGHHSISIPASPTRNRKSSLKTGSRSDDIIRTSSVSEHGQYYNMQPSLPSTEADSMMSTKLVPTKAGAIESCSFSAHNNLSESLLSCDDDDDDDDGDFNEIDDDCDDHEDGTDASRGDRHILQQKPTEEPHLAKSRRYSLETMITRPLTTDDSYLSHSYSKGNHLENMPILQSTVIPGSDLPKSRCRKIYENVCGKILLDELDPLNVVEHYSRPKRRKAREHMGVASLPSSRSTTLSRADPKSCHRRKMSSLEDFDLL
ncbi:insulin-like growth factor 1 receptor isoform X2 [Macrobrachium nipponense]|uniref:insulin-like growth factor 1 receptor isoform X2 n=1 Tax=Macrobrachium nipponense TaxID=159736 RepID=UPI0030C7BBD9